MATQLKPEPLCCPIEVDRAARGESPRPGRVAVFKALSDPTRLRILKTISHMHEMCECNIVPVFGLSQPTISYHLKVLREAGLITSERRGQWVWHRVNEKAVLNAVRQPTEIAGVSSMCRPERGPARGDRMRDRDAVPLRRRASTTSRRSPCAVSRSESGALTRGSFPADALPAVEAFAAAERQCCAGIGWDVAERSVTSLLRISARTTLPSTAIEAMIRTTI